MSVLEYASTCVCDQDSIGELDTDRQEESKTARRREEEEEEKGRKSALLFGSEDTFDSIASLEEKVHALLVLLVVFIRIMGLPVRSGVNAFYVTASYLYNVIYLQ